MTTRIILWACPLCETPATESDVCTCGTAFEACVEYDVEIDRSPDAQFPDDWENELRHVLALEDWRVE